MPHTFAVSSHPFTDPETRVLARIDISDTVEADEVTNLLMGASVPPRRAFIIEEAKYAKLDV